MAVSEDDVRHVASLARLGLDPERVAGLVSELNGILGHMDVLRVVDSSSGTPASQDEPTPLRPDDGPQLRLDRARDDFAPAMRDGFFLVPRLASHEGEGERTA